MDDRAFRGAAQKLRNDVRSAVERWIAEDYPTGANVKSKGELLELVDDLADRAASAADGRGGNNDDRPPGNSGQTGTKGT